jgi:SAM-dependent methyltransferase
MHDHGGGGAPQGVLVSAMWTYAATVLYPARALKQAGVGAETVLGDEPEGLPRKGLGPYFSRRYPEPVLLDEPTEHDELVVEFDRSAEVYAAFVRPFSRPIFDEALGVLGRYLSPDSRVLDAGCGPGQELERVGRLVPDGEVVGIDLAAGMVKTAHRAARAHGLDHSAFFQSDVGALPRVFTGKFDLAYNCLAHHHYPEPERAAREVLRCLRPGGVYCIVDPGPEWYNRMSVPLARWADPGWISFHTPEEFRGLLSRAGFARTAWIDLLPGFGIAVGQRAREVRHR